MKDYIRFLRPWLESWGDWRRFQLAIGFPKTSISCDPNQHTALPIQEPSFKMPVFTYNKNLTLEQNARRYGEQIQKAERRIREYHHIKRSETKPKRHSIVPNYDPHWRMNLIDRLIADLKPKLNQVIDLRYARELKIKEIAFALDSSENTIHKQIARAHYQLRLIPTLMVSHGTQPIRDHNQQNASNHF